MTVTTIADYVSSCERLYQPKMIPALREASYNYKKSTLFLTKPLPKKMVTPNFFDRVRKAEECSTATLKMVTIFVKKKESQIPTTDNAFFDRMSKTETFATLAMKGKNLQRNSNLSKTNGQSKKERNPGKFSKNYPLSYSDEKTSNAFFDRLSKTETYATSSMKQKIYLDHADKMQHNRATYGSFDKINRAANVFGNSITKKKVSQNLITTQEPERPQRVKTTNEFFDRMSRAHTFASSTNVSFDKINRATNVFDTSITKKRVSQNLTTTQEPERPQRVKTTNEFFDRMSRAHTFASSTMNKKFSQVEINPKREHPQKLSNKSADLSIFHRLSKAETVSSTNKRCPPLQR